MKKLAAVLTMALVAVSVGGAAFADLNINKSVSSEDTKPYVKKERFLTRTAMVEAVDVEHRVVTLKGEKGKIFDVRVVPEAKNLAQLKKGDLVTLKYYEAVSAQVYKAGEAPKVTGATAAVETAKAGAKPGGKLAYVATTTATIEAIDMKKPEVTLKTADGKTLAVKIQRPKLLANVKVGDEVVITYSEAVAISVTKAKK